MIQLLTTTSRERRRIPIMVVIVPLLRPRRDIRLAAVAVAGLHRRIPSIPLQVFLVLGH